MSIFRKFTANLSKNTKKPFFMNLLYVFIGGLGYVTIPTMLKGWLKWDMDGWKGALTGVITTSLMALGFNKPYICYGAIASFGTHLIYTKGNGIFTQIFETPIFTFLPDTATKVNDYVYNLKEGNIPMVEEYNQIRLPDGSPMLVSTSLPTAKANTNANTQVNDYVTTLEDYTDKLEDLVDTRAFKPAYDLASAVENGWLN